MSTPLLDLAERAERAEAAKRHGMRVVDENANAGWKDFILDVIRAVCLQRAEFTGDDIMDAYDAWPEPKPATHDARALGPAVNRARALGYCQPSSRYAKSNRRHKSPQMLWKSRLFEGGATDADL